MRALRRGAAAPTENTHLDIKVSVPAGMQGKLEGLLGDFDGNPNNELKLRNGEITTSLAALNEDWRLLDSESLFSTATFTIEQDCELIVDHEAIEAARQLYLVHFGEEPDNAILSRMSTDLAAGMVEPDIIAWVTEMLGKDIADSIGGLPIEAAVYEGDGFPEISGDPVRTTRINDIDFIDYSQDDHTGIEKLEDAFGERIHFSVDLMGAFRIPVAGEYTIALTGADGFYLGIERLGEAGGVALLNVEGQNLSGSPVTTFGGGYPIVGGWTTTPHNMPETVTLALLFEAPGDYNFEVAYYQFMATAILHMEVQGPPGSGLNEAMLQTAPVEFFTTTDR